MSMVLRQDRDGKLILGPQLPRKMALDLRIVVQYFPISDQWRARSDGLARASGEAFISRPYQNPVFAVANLLMQLADYTDSDTSLALETALGGFLKDDEPKEQEETSTGNVS